MITAIVFIIVLALLIITHELGHFVAAKKAGIRVDEFGFGFPPKLFGIKKGETEYTLNLLPVGGFVKIFGENPDEESIAGPDMSRSLVNQPRWIQAIVLAAGVFMNVVLAWVLVSISLSLGMPMAIESVPQGVEAKNVQLLVTNVLKNSPAEKAGLKPGDELVSLKAGTDSAQNLSAESVKKFVSPRGGEPINLTYRRAGTESTLKVTPKPGSDSSAAIGVMMAKVGTVQLSIPRAFWTGMGFTYNLTVATAEGFVYFIKGLLTQGKSALADVAGPIGLFNMVGDASRMGFVYLLNFTALISINLAVLNLLPIPALDGGRLMFLAIEAIKGSRLNPKIANAVNVVGFLLLMLLMVIVAASDIFKLL